MELVTLFIVLLLCVIAVTLVIISIKLTDILSETKATRIATQNIESDDVVHKNAILQQQSDLQTSHHEELLQLLKRVELLLSQRLKVDKAKFPSETSVKQDAHQATLGLFNAKNR